MTLHAAAMTMIFHASPRQEACAAHTRCGGIRANRSQENSEVLPLMPGMPESPRGPGAGDAISWSHPTVAFAGEISMSRESSSGGNQTATSVGRKCRHIIGLTLEIGDSTRHRSGVRRMSLIPSPATTSSRRGAMGAAASGAAEIALIAPIGKSLEESTSDGNPCRVAQNRANRGNWSAAAERRPRKKVDVATVAVLATAGATVSPARGSANQAVDPADRRQESTSMLDPPTSRIGVPRRATAGIVQRMIR